MNKEKEEKILFLIFDFYRDMFETKKDLNRLYTSQPSMVRVLKEYGYESVYEELLVAVNGFNPSMKDDEIEKERERLFKKFLKDYPEFNTGKDKTTLLKDTREMLECIHREYRQLKMYTLYIYTLLDEILLKIIDLEDKIEIPEWVKSKGIKVKIEKMHFDNFKKFSKLKAFNAERNAIVHAKGVFNKMSIRLMGGEEQAREVGIHEDEEVELSKEKIMGYIDLCIEFLKYIEVNKEKII